jgi:hypothetical protein
VAGPPDGNEGRWLVWCDVDANRGRGAIRTTEDRADAASFPDAAEAMRYWKRTSHVRPKRPDGKPNRPLTAYTIEIVRDGTEPI